MAPWTGNGASEKPARYTKSMLDIPDLLHAIQAGPEILPTDKYLKDRKQTNLWELTARHAHTREILHSL